MKLQKNYFGRMLWAILLLAGLVTACYDDSDVREQLQDHESGLKELERLTAQQNTNISSLQTIVTALQDKDYVTNVAPINEGDKVVGYTITFSKSGTVTIYNGKDGYVPAMGVKQDTDGLWYWTVDGEWLLDSNGYKVRASAVDGEDGEPGTPGQSGVTPTLKIVDGYWYVSYDGGKTWEEEPLGQATGDKGYTMFAEVTYDEEYLYITMADGEKLTLSLTAEEAGGGDPETGGEGENNDAITNVFGGVTLTVSLRNLTEIGVSFYGETKFTENYTANSFGILYSTQNVFTAVDACNLPIVDIYGTNYSVSTSSLKPNTTYYYTSYIKQGDLYKYGDIKSFTTMSLVAPTLNDASQITGISATISGTVALPSEIGYGLEYGFEYCTSQNFASGVAIKTVTDFESESEFSVELNSLTHFTTYYYRSYIKMSGVTVNGEPKSFRTLQHPYESSYGLNVASATDLSSSGSANCYIVSDSGLFKFKTVKGNSSESVGSVTSASLLWETFGTSTSPECLDLISGFCYKAGYIIFQTADLFKEGNAVIAAKDADGNILWSWHIWFTDQPEGQVYYNNAGIMMDRNLGATSATPGDVGAFGLLYQWGRKDPFLGSSNISCATLAKSTIIWPSAVATSPSAGTIEYVISHPTTFVTSALHPSDWHYSSHDNTLWTTSDKTKSIYDPCPVGWRVPDGVWSKAGFDDTTYESTSKGISFSISTTSTVWYPASGVRTAHNGDLYGVGCDCGYWSASPDSSLAYGLDFNGNGYFEPSDFDYRAAGLSVRCLRE